jgi:hypothetical protein
MLATDTRIIWVSKTEIASEIPSKEESDKENSLGETSKWLQTALERLKAMPFFGLMHRLTESFELMGFHLCFPVTTTASATKKPRSVGAEFQRVVDQYFVLDTLLLREAEKLFDDLVSDMRRKKEKGVLCDMSRVLRQPDVELGINCK